MAAKVINSRGQQRRAGALCVHKNTVRYRIARAEELLGHPVAEPAALVELPLRHVEAFGPPIEA